MTEIPGTTSIKANKSNDTTDIAKNIKLESVIDVLKIKRAKLKPSSLDFYNKEFRLWVITTSFLVGLFVIYLCFTSIKFIILIFSGPGIGIVSFYFKEKFVGHFHENDKIIRRHVKFW